MSENFSYSKLETYEQCSFKYKLKYVDGHYVYSSSIATEFGTAIHETEEAIAHYIMDGQDIDYIKLKNDLLIKCLELQHKYPEDFISKDKSDRTYQDKLYYYLENGIYRLESLMKANPTYKILGAEVPFEFQYKKYGTFKGFIDRVILDTATNTCIVQDIKTWAVPAEHDKLVTPLQFVVYSLAIRQLYSEVNSVHCQYDLPLCELIQDAGTKGYIERGQAKLDKIFTAINAKEWTPKPTPLCHWCEFCQTNPNAPEEARYLCPYYSCWTRENKTFAKENEWQGLEQHQKILEAFYKKYNIKIELTE